MATGPIETHLHHSFNWENAAPGARIGQKRVAYEVTKDIHGEVAANEAFKMSQALFSGEVASLSEKEIEELFGEFKKAINGPITLEDLLIELGAATSKREARTFVTGNSVAINGTKVTDPKAMIDQSMLLHGKYVIVKRGKGKGSGEPFLGCTNYKQDGTGCDNFMTRDYYIKHVKGR